ncbi:MAG TPA: cupredoxin domain-containing protein [Roseiflexaceae bacterium]|nr:cupredoxin domain-containing protein [Roseiflexaceae bacterium]
MTTMTDTPVRTRAPLSALSKTTIGALAGIALVVGYVAAALIKSVDPIAGAVIGLPLLAAGLIATGWRWAPALGVLVTGLLAALLGMVRGEVASNIGGPLFAPLVVLIALTLVGLTSGVAALVQNYRRPAGERRTPRALPLALTAVAAFTTGLIALASLPQAGVRMGISPEVLATLPAVTVDTFTGGEIRVKAGETVALRLDNPDFAAHSFDVDELNVHAPMPAGEQGLAVFKATQPGVYRFYCAPHYDKATGQGMHGTLVVE